MTTAVDRCTIRDCRYPCLPCQIGNVRIESSDVIHPDSKTSRCLLPARLAPHILVFSVAAVPGSIFPAYRRADIVDPTESPAILSSRQERTVPEPPAGRILPEPDLQDIWQIPCRNIGAAYLPVAVQVYRHMLQYILLILPDPRDKVINCPFLAPSPPLAAVPALPADLFGGHDSSQRKSMEKGVVIGLDKGSDIFGLLRQLHRGIQRPKRHCSAISMDQGDKIIE